MTLRSVRLLEALNTAEITYRACADDNGAVMSALTDFLVGAYNLDSSAVSIVQEAINGNVPPVRAVKAIKAIAAMYEDEA